MTNITNYKGYLYDDSETMDKSSKYSISKGLFYSILQLSKPQPLGDRTIYEGKSI